MSAPGTPAGQESPSRPSPSGAGAGAVAARVVLAVVAVLVCAWLVLEARQAHGETQVTSILSGAHRPSAADLRRAAAAIPTAGALDPDAEVQLLRGAVQMRMGQRSAALQQFLAAARREPDNVAAWTLVASAAGRDSRLLEQAYGRIGALKPHVPASP